MYREQPHPQAGAVLVEGVQHVNRQTQLDRYLFDVFPGITPTFPTIEVSRHTGGGSKPTHCWGSSGGRQEPRIRVMGQMSGPRTRPEEQRLATGSERVAGLMVRLGGHHTGDSRSDALGEAPIGQVFPKVFDVGHPGLNGRFPST